MRRRAMIVFAGAGALAVAGAARGFVPAQVPAAFANGLLLGALVLIAAFLLVITRLEIERGRAEHRLQTTIGALRSKDSRLRHALDGAHEGWWDWDAARDAALVSPRTREIIGLEVDTAPAEVVALWRERLLAQDRERVDLAVSRHVRYDVPLDVTYRVSLPEGVLRWVRMRGQAQREENGKLRSISGFVADVTEQKLANTAQAHLAARHASVIAALPDLIFEIDDDGRYLRCHASNEDDLAAPPAHLIGRHLSDVLPAGVVAQIEEAFGEVRKQGGCAMLTFALDTQAAREQFFEARVVRIETGGYLCVVRNITERKAAEEELVRHRDNLAELVAEQTVDLLLAKEAAERASRGQRDFLSTLSHELRAPLHAIMGFAEMARAPTVTSARRTHCLERIEHSGERLLAMISELLDVARHEAARGPVHLTPVDWATVCDDVLAECEALISAKHMTVQCEFGDTACPVRADGPRLRQVVMNLVTNAIKFSPDRAALALRLQGCAHTTGGGAVVALEIEDNGIGLPEGGADHIFEAFVRAEGDDPVVAGSGLGLSICRQYVEVFGGTISARPASGGGALFRVELPCAAAHGTRAELAA